MPPFNETGGSQHMGRWSAVVLPLLVTAFFASIHVWWLHRDTTALYWDMGRHGLDSLRSFDQLTESGLPLVSRLSAFSEGPDPYYPPFYYWLATIPVALFGRTADAIALTGLLFAGLLNVAVFGIARRIAGTWAGFMACLVGSSLPMIFDFTHQVMLDLPLTAMVAATLWSLCERPFDSFARAAGLGLCLAFGFLTKWTFPAFVALPCAWACLQRLFYRQLRDGRLAVRWRSLAAAFLSITMALALALPWVALHRGHLAGVSEAQTHVPGISGRHWSETGALLAGHFRALFENQMDLLSISMLGIAVAAALASREWRRRTTSLLLTLASSILVWGVLGKHQDVRYSMPQLAAAVPLVALFPAILGRGPLDRARPLFQALLVGWCSFAVVNMALAPSILRHPILQRWRIAPQFAFHSGPPKDTPSEEPLRAIFEAIAASGRPQVARFVETNSDERGLDGWSAAFYAEQFRVRLSGWDPSFTLLQVEGGRPAGPGRWFPVPGDEQKGIWLTENDRPWERRVREAAGLALQARMAFDAGTRFHIVEHDGAGEGVLVVLEDGHEVDGAVLRPHAVERYAVRCAPGATVVVEAWGRAPVSVRARPEEAEALRTADLGVDIGIDHPVNGKYAGPDRLVYTPDLPRRAPGILFAGPYLSLPPGEYRASLRWSSIRPLSGQQAVELRIALGRRLRVLPARMDASSSIAPGDVSLLEVSFKSPRPLRRAEFVVAVEGIDAGQVEARGMTLWVKGAALMEKLLAYNAESHWHRRLFQLQYPND